MTPSSGSIVILGADGFLGSHLTDALLARGVPVRAFDRFPEGRARNLRVDNPFLEVLAGDFLNRGDLERAVDGARTVVHLISLTTPATSAVDPTFDVETNVRMSVELLRACVTAGVQRIVFASTGGAIYGRDSERPFLETDAPLPISPYAIGKLAIEGYLRHFAIAHGLQSTTLRISNPYGPRQNIAGAQGAIPIFLKLMHDRDPITVYGDGSMVRDYIYVDDMVDMVLRVLDGDPRDDLYHVGSGDGHSVMEVLAALRRATGIEPVVRHAPSRPTDVGRVLLDTTRFRSEFGPVNATPLDAGIAATWRSVLGSIGRGETATGETSGARL